MSKKLVVGIIAHVDAGKTTLSEALLYNTGSIRKLGRVDHMDSHMDTDEIEKKRGITIYTGQSQFVYKDMEVTFLDTPGHVDFSTEMERALSVLDIAILVISGLDGVQSHTRTLMKLIKAYDIPTFIFVNKMDITHKTNKELLENINKNFGIDAIDFDTLDRDELIAMTDEDLLDKYMQFGKLSSQDITDAISKRTIYPLLFGSALKNDGVDKLLDLINNFAPFPSVNNEFSAITYKIARDKNHVRETYLKITGGELHPKDMILKNGAYPNEAEKINEIRLYDGIKYTAVNLALPGDIVAITGIENSAPGVGFGIENDARLPELAPVLSYSVILSKKQNPIVMYRYFKELMDEDPMLNVRYNETTQQISIELMGKIQLEVLRQKFFDRFGEDIDFGVGNIVYKETIITPTIGHGHYEPLKHFADVVLSIEPGETGSGIVVTSSTSTDVLPKNYQHQIFNYLCKREQIGILTGSTLTDIKIDIISGKSHTKHTEGGDFRRATNIALRDGLLRTESVLLEPFYNVILEIPQSNVGRSMTDIQSMGGTVENSEIGIDLCSIKAKVPVANILNYGSEVASYTGGLGVLSLSFAGYYPCHNQEEVIDKIGYNYLKDIYNPYESIYVHQDNHISLPLKVLKDKGLLDDKGLVIDMLSNEDKPSKRKADEAKGLGGTGGLEPELEKIFRNTYGDIKQYKNVDPTKNIVMIDKLKKLENIKNAREQYKKTHINKAAKQDKAEKKNYLLVDGYNLIYAWPRLKDLSQVNIDSARDALLDVLDNYHGFTGYEIIVVFDAYHVKGGKEKISKYNNLHVVYTKEAETADSYIEKATHKIRSKGNSNIRVVSSDGIIQLIIMSEGALRISSREFVKLYESESYKDLDF